jgi:hypothetical protein
MADTGFVSEEVAVVEAAPFERWGVNLSWSGVIAGALTAIAVTAIIIALGSGVGLSLASPFASSPSASSLTLIGALWLVFAQAIGFATGGYMAGRLRSNPGRWHTDEVKFRDAANGLVVWAIGVLLSLLLVAGAVSKVGSAAGTATATGVLAAANQAPSMDYFTDILLRTNPATPPAQGSGDSTQAPASAENVAGSAQQVNRILFTAIGPSGLSSDDRTYLAQIVSARSGMSMDDAQKRVDDVVNRAKADVRQAADTARKAAEYFAFWTFMSLLFGAACATLGGMIGGDIRDELGTRDTVSTVPR